MTVELATKDDCWQNNKKKVTLSLHIITELVSKTVRIADISCINNNYYFPLYKEKNKEVPLIFKNFKSLVFKDGFRSKCLCLIAKPWDSIRLLCLTVRI